MHSCTRDLMFLPVNLQADILLQFMLASGPHSCLRSMANGKTVSTNLNECPKQAPD
jgi:hypothetical protein